MVLSLPVPSFARSATSPPLRSTDSNVQPPLTGEASTVNSSVSSSLSQSSSSTSLREKTTNSKRPWERLSSLAVAAASSSSSSSSRSVANSHSATLSEALRNNPFGSSNSALRTRLPGAAVAQSQEHGDGKEASSHVQQQRDDKQREQDELNDALVTLAQIFPDVKAEVFRELLVRFDGLSRLQVCVEQLLRYKTEWVAGRWNVPNTKTADKPVGRGATVARPANTVLGIEEQTDQPIPLEEFFRTEQYKSTVKALLVKEFSGLSKSTIDAVLAEVNFSYGRARPTLQALAKKTWRATINSILPSFKRKKDKSDHPLLLWQRQDYSDEPIPVLKHTGCLELDQELHDMLLAPIILQRKEASENHDYRLAHELNESEARAADALFECECCLNDVTFEQISTCSVSSHVVCFSCIQRTVQEALFGQGWAKSVDLARSTLKCLAPLSHGTCDGYLQHDTVRRAVLLERSGVETYRKFEDRLASETLLKSQMKLIRCPFCSYAEADPAYHPSSRGIVWRFRRDGFISTAFLVILLLDLIPLLAVPILVLLVFDSSLATSFLQNSLLNLRLKKRPKRFTCASPACKRASCIVCQKPWRDPHVCHEPLLLDLRATVEAARTAAIKRTCPRCGLSFVKSSGCNKLTCVCGYSMCYLCRKALGPPLKTRRRRVRRRRRRTWWNNQENVLREAAVAIGNDYLAVEGQNADGNDANDGNPYGEYDDNYDDNQEREAEEEEWEEEEEDDDAEPEGYKHFCEHFRINPGSRCAECTKCDLYEAEDEEAVARRAGEKAEREWRLRQGMACAGVRSVNSEFGSVQFVSGPATARRAIAAIGGGGATAAQGSQSWALDLQLAGHSGKGLRYWVWDVWRQGLWKLEGQQLVDWIVERVVLIEDF